MLLARLGRFKPTRHYVRLSLVALLAMLSWQPGIARADNSNSFYYYSLPRGSRPLSITAGPDGNVWFTENIGNQLDKFTVPRVVTENPLPNPNNSPDAIVSGQSGTGTIKLLANTVRIQTTLDGTTPKLIANNSTIPRVGDGSTTTIKVAGTNGIPANATGINGILTNVNCDVGGNLRFWTGTTPPFSINLNVPGLFMNIPGGNDFPFNLSTSFTAALDASGQLNLGWSSFGTNTCGYAVDVVGYVVPPTQLPALLSRWIVRCGSKQLWMAQIRNWSQMAACQALMTLAQP